MRRLLAPIVVLAFAGCGQSNPHLIPQSNADALTATADKIQAACDARDTTTVLQEIRNAEHEIDALPSSVSSSLRTNLKDWVERMRARRLSDCREEATPTPSPEATETATPTETATAAPTETATEAPTQAPTDTATPAPTTTPAPTETATAAPTTTPEAP